MHPIVRTVLQRLGLGLLTLFIVSLVIFSALEMLPGGFAEAILGQSATPETVAAFNQRDRPRSPGRSCATSNGSAASLRGDFGKSYRRPRRQHQAHTSADMIAPRLYNTLFLAADGGHHRRAAGAGPRRRWRHFTATAGSTASSIR